MPTETMTSRERWLAVLKREKPDRVPMDYQATSEATQKLLKYLGCDSVQAMYERLHVDKLMSVGGVYRGPPVASDEDVFGCKHRNVNYGTGVYRECVYSPLAGYKRLGEIESNYTWPDPDWWDYSQLPRQVEANEDYPILGGGSEPFLIYKQLRGQEQAFVDLVENPDIVHYCLDKLFQLCYEDTRRIYERIPGRVMLTGVAEDLGGQENLMYSPEHIRTFFIPRMKRMIDIAHEAGAFVFHHSDGAVRAIIPDMIKAGIDILNPIQWRCRGMEREQLKRDFGDAVIFHGGVDNQQTLAFGSVEDVRREVVDNLGILGKGGGYILAPCHNIQPVSPAENMVALYETGYEYG